MGTSHQSSPRGLAPWATALALALLLACASLTPRGCQAHPLVRGSSSAGVDAQVTSAKGPQAAKAGAAARFEEEVSGAAGMLEGGQAYAVEGEEEEEDAVGEGRTILPGLETTRRIATGTWPQQGEKGRVLAQMMIASASASDCADRSGQCSAWAPDLCRGDSSFQSKPIRSYWCPNSCNACDREVITPSATWQNETGPCTVQCGQAQAMLKLVNDFRAAAGKPPVCLSDKLSEAAQAHSNDMAQNKIFRNIGSDGSTPSQRLDAAGFRWRAWAQNIGRNFNAPRFVFNAWSRNRGNKQNILGNYNFMGSYQSGKYWTQVFARSPFEACNN